jgi:hypothetical protein
MRGNDVRHARTQIVDSVKSQTYSAAILATGNTPAC